MVDSQISLFSLMASAQDYIATETGSLETNKLAKDAAMQAVIDYQERHKTKQISLFAEQSDNVWGDAGAGAAFCELSCTFFASFTERQLKYYIERAAASSIDNYDTLKAINHQLSEQSKAIAEHTFEISKLVQSFYAGWFNKQISLFSGEYQVLDVAENTDVMLFSGGLDSLAGAVQRLNKYTDRSLCVVSHKFNKTVTHTQKVLIDELNKQYGNRVKQ